MGHARKKNPQQNAKSNSDSNWGDDAEQQTLRQPAGSSTRLIALFTTLAVVLLLVVFVKKALPPPTDPTKEPAVGKRPESLHLTPLEGDAEPITLASLQGDVVLINFWGPWCPPCRAEFPELMELREALAKTENFRFVSVSAMPNGDEDDLVKMTKRFLLPQKYDLPVYRDSDLTTREELRELNQSRDFPFPTTILLDRQGVIRAVWIGYQQGVGEQMREFIGQMLKETSKQTFKQQSS